MGRVVRQASGIGLLAYPPPFVCWLALSSDPDHTRLEDWCQIHALIWSKLGLPFADSFFGCNRNLQKPDQVSLADHPDIARAHPHDTMHTWGDYIFSGSHRFTRKDAEADLLRLRDMGVVPLVWTDHSNFAGNLLHRPSTTVAPTIRDSSGHEYVNEVYTLDLARQAGVAYVWDGTLGRRVVGQDRPVTRWEWYRKLYSPPARLGIVAMDRLTRPAAALRNPDVFDYTPDCNRQYYPHQFPDGTRVYRFPRFGSWGLGDIDGLGRVLAPSEVARLEHAQGTAIVYTHLGKRVPARASAPDHVPPATVEALTHLAARHRAGVVQLSATSKLLDYLVLRDHMKLEPGTVDFRPDGIRFPRLTGNDLKGHSFGFRATGAPPRVLCNGEPIEKCALDRVGDAYRLSVE